MSITKQLGVIREELSELQQSTFEHKYQGGGKQNCIDAALGLIMATSDYISIIADSDEIRTALKKYFEGDE